MTFVIRARELTLTTAVNLKCPLLSGKPTKDSLQAVFMSKSVCVEQRLAFVNIGPALTQLRQQKSSKGSSMQNIIRKATGI